MTGKLRRDRDPDNKQKGGTGLLCIYTKFVAQTTNFTGQGSPAFHLKPCGWTAGSDADPCRAQWVIIRFVSVEMKLRSFIKLCRRPLRTFGGFSCDCLLNEAMKTVSVDVVLLVISNVLFVIPVTKCRMDTHTLLKKTRCAQRNSGRGCHVHRELTSLIVGLVLGLTKHSLVKCRVTFIYMTDSARLHDGI